MCTCVCISVGVGVGGGVGVYVLNLCVDMQSLQCVVPTTSETYICIDISIHTHQQILPCIETDSL